MNKKPNPPGDRRLPNPRFDTPLNDETLKAFGVAFAHHSDSDGHEQIRGGYCLVLHADHATSAVNGGRPKTFDRDYMSHMAVSLVTSLLARRLPVLPEVGRRVFFMALAALETIQNPSDMATAREVAAALDFESLRLSFNAAMKQPPDGL